MFKRSLFVFVCVVLVQLVYAMEIVRVDQDAEQGLIVAWRQFVLPNGIGTTTSIVKNIKTGHNYITLSAISPERSWMMEPQLLDIKNADPAVIRLLEAKIAQVEEKMKKEK